ncbi:MAG TPA: 30S ribosomal protein S20 [Bacillota bacterium]|nr:30S ribosomal protein S20 [Bacillota bacterium]
MPNIKSAKKRVQITAKKTALNKAYKTRFRTLIRKIEEEPSEENLARAMSAIDKASKKGILHKNNAARKKARLARLLKAAAE